MGLDERGGGDLERREWWTLFLFEWCLSEDESEDEEEELEYLRCFLLCFSNWNLNKGYTSVASAWAGRMSRHYFNYLNS